MVGDHKQLSPPAFTDEGKGMWGESAFERIVKKDYPKTLLNVQYRSHEILYRPTSEIFYENAVRSDRVRPQLNGVLLHNGGFEIAHMRKTWAIKSEVAFLHYRGETILDDSHSIMNPGEQSFMGTKS
ncbi:hypothetical protein DTO166G4_176 [Paecilomyces variotii]|nr:hypothetical protein DTO166G4_176 [Paecilomyces variotii]KAJ9227719.1 hypothetical protein DTO166G5_9221 [Paecilomyces variotii]KAJ9233025.1 hypothetical protein DTO169E5_7234 [Paecilomyces variotii]KAJ9250052.1 hypothetical protein DTO207G8_6365 [Paecilomyces variotii]KAJ9263356.1 hypothetical protein DTO195F2_3012 [Paecilomyces variotii]